MKKATPQASPVKPFIPTQAINIRTKIVKAK